jgi:uncharacterized protein with FMN-binding domain
VTGSRKADLLEIDRGGPITLSFNTSMTEKQPPAYRAMLVLTIALSILAIVTMLPSPGASKPNVLGYRSVCSFAPAASALCGLLAGITCTLRNRLASRLAASRRWAPLFAPVGVSIVLVAITVVFAVSFGRAQARFQSVIGKTQAAGGAFGAMADGVYAASAAEGEVSAAVELTVNAGRVDDIRLVEGKNVEASLAARIFEAVISTQSTQVDGVSGATASSQVLLKAVAAAASAAPRAQAVP